LGPLPHQAASGGISGRGKHGLARTKGFADLSQKAVDDPFDGMGIQSKDGRHICAGEAIEAEN
jgi:hypothetical protein